MKTNIIIYSKNGTTPLIQVFDASDVVINLKTNEPSSSTFSIPLWDSKGDIHQCLKQEAYLLEWNRVQVTAQDDGVETVEFEGYIDDVDVTSRNTTITLVSYLWKLEERLVHANQSFSNTQINSVINGLIAYINELEDTWLTLSCDVIDLITKQWTGGTYMLPILSEIAEVGFHFLTRGKVLYFWKDIGVDRTSGEDYFAFFYNYIDTRGNNVLDFNFKRNGKNIKNDVYTKASSSIVNANDPTSITTYGRRQAYITTKNSGELNKYLTEHKERTTELTIKPNKIHFRSIDIADKIWVDIDRWDVHGKYNGAMYVVSKEIRFTDGNPEVTIGLSSGTVKSPNVLEQIRTMERDIQKMKVV